MTTLLLLPGYGGKYTSPVFGTSSTSADGEAFDCSRCAHLAVQVVHDSGTPAGSVTLQQTLDGENWADYGEAVDVATEGAIARYGIEFGPMGVLRIDPADISSGEVHLTVVGWPLAEVN